MTDKQQGQFVETPAGKGRIVAATQLIKGWYLRVELMGGGIWTGFAEELKGVRDALEEYRHGLGEDPGAPRR